MKKSDGPGETFFRRGFAREEVQARGDDRYCKNARGNGAPEFLLQVVVIKVRAEEGTEADDVRLPGNLSITNPARGKREHDGENDPANGNPGRVERFLKDPNHHAGCDPCVGRSRNLEVPIVLGTEALGKPIAADNDRQRAERAHQNGVPAVNTGRIGRESCVDGETRKKIRVPGKRVITNRARGFRQNHRKGDEREWLPKLRHLKPDKKRDESASCSREEATNGTLLGIVTQSC